MKLRITISKYHSWYLCQISLQIMLLPIQIIFSILVILWPITWPYTAITFFLIAFSNYNVVFFHFRMSYFVWSQLKLKKLFFFSGFAQTWKVPEFLTNPQKVLEFRQESIPENHHILTKKTPKISEFPICIWLEFQTFRVVNGAMSYKLLSF